jgi:CRP-like cAMP-binding protein
MGVEVEPESADPMSDGRFAEELQALVDGAFPALPSGPEAGAAAPPTGPSQIVVSPLFRDFSVDEMVAVIQGLNLLSYERGDVILREGAPGDSLYMLTTGMVRAFRKDAAGRQVRLGDLVEGAFFGEVSILTGGRRTATVAALTRCELLELDRPTLDSIRKTHPHVLEVLEEFARQRGAKPN